MFTGVHVLTVDHAFLTSLYKERELLVYDLLPAILKDESCFKPFPHLFVVLISYDSNHQKSSALAKISKDSTSISLLKDYTKNSVF